MSRKQKTNDVTKDETTPEENHTNSKTVIVKNGGVPGKQIQILLKTLTHGDCKIRCSSDINVKQLKLQIHQEFPSKPKVEDQKLIHAGILLNDDVELRNAFRLQVQLTANDFSNSCPEFIIHLVCTAKGSPVFKRHQTYMSPTGSENNSSGSLNNDVNSENSSQTPVRDFQPLPSRACLAQRSPFRQHQFSKRSSYVNDFVNTHSNGELLQQIMDEMKLQHTKYYESVRNDILKDFKGQATEYNENKEPHSKVIGRRQFISHMTEENRNVTDRHGTDKQNETDNNAELSNEDINNNARAALDQRHRENAAVLNDAARGVFERGAAREGDGGNERMVNNNNDEENDWLSWLYRESRLVVLLVILYSYSSLNRVLTVGVVTLLVYFFQRRWLPLFGRELMRRNEGNNNVNDGENEQGEAAAEGSDRNSIQQPSSADGDEETAEAEEGAARQSRRSDGVTSTEAVDQQQQQDSHQRQHRQQQHQAIPPEQTRITTRIFTAMETLVVALTTFFVSLFPIELRPQQQNV